MKAEYSREEIQMVADFMGVKMRHMGPVDYLCDDYGNVDFTDDPTVYAPHKNWNQLMPVVEKIAEYRLAYPKETGWVCECKIVVMQKFLYREVVNFIKFYNTHSLGTN